ncbi:hypothetical protein RJ495_005094 [Pluralibacter gergoviae]|nr:hypothetical protein [Pluralibacter gergoviae]ELD4303980.1 hypothetical protein [Pluralibacter gergoviae]
MRAFNTSQIEVFLNAFGETIQTSTGANIRVILEEVPVTISSGSGGFIEGTETYCSARKSDIDGIIDIGTELVIKNINYTVYNIVDDLSGVVDIYYRTEQGQHFAEDY